VSRALLAALAALALPLPARAQAVLHEGGPADYRSPQRWALELRFGPYYPDVDSEFSGDPAQRPHRLYFGKDKRVMMQLEVDYQFFQAFGTLAVGMQIGYFSESAKAFVESGAGDRSNDSTRLWLLPAALTLVYRFDVAARHWDVPLVPYGKVGLGYTLWTITDGNGKVATFDGDRGRGGTPGWQAAAGLALMLDVLDPGAARELDGEIGVNHTYLFIEATHVAASGLGRKGTLDVGDSTWMAGLMFEF
jgi:hypothetical protein